MKEVIIVDGVDCLTRISCLKGVVECAREKPKALIIPVNGKKGYDWRLGKISGGKWMGVTLRRDFGIKNLIIVEENVKTAAGAIIRSREILEKKNLLEDISTIIIFCQDGKEKGVRNKAKKVFKGKEIEVFTFPIPKSK